MSHDKREGLREKLRKIVSLHINTRIDMPSFIDDLEDLFPPEPDREGLEKIIGLGLTSTLAAPIMAWAAGEGEKREWCNHWEWVDKAGWRYTEDGINLGLGHKAKWDICPVAGCHAPRPKERP